MPTTKKPGLTVIVLTLDEEPNLPWALDSVRGWADQVLVLDSFSHDRTVELAKEHGAEVFQHAFVDYGRQRNYALTELPIAHEWVLFLDADERVSDALKVEITQKIESNPLENGFFVKFRLIWMGRWIRRGYYPTWILRLFRHGWARCEDRSVNEHLVVDGEVGYLEHDLLHEDRKGLAAWVAKHDRYARREAAELLRKQAEHLEGQIDARLFGTQAQRVRWIRHRIWDRFPLLVRPFTYFGWRYFVRGGALDGPEALVYHFLHALWYPMLTDAYLLELRGRQEQTKEF
jgi:glycosyltransferase involved in cell wall biosynthesis